MVHQHFILKDKKPVSVDLVTWAKWFQENKEERIIRRSEIGKVWISTVFLGVDHNFSQEGPPLLYETLVVGGKFDDHMRRYATYEDAVKGHEEVLRMVSEKE